MGVASVRKGGPDLQPIGGSSSPIEQDISGPANNRIIAQTRRDAVRPGSTDHRVVARTSGEGVVTRAPGKGRGASGETRHREMLGLKPEVHIRAGGDLHPLDVGNLGVASVRKGGPDLQPIGGSSSPIEQDISGRANNRIIAALAEDRIVAFPAVQPIVAMTATEGVVADQTEKRIIGIVADQAVRQTVSRPGNEPAAKTHVFHLIRQGVAAYIRYHPVLSRGIQFHNRV